MAIGALRVAIFLPFPSADWSHARVCFVPSAVGMVATNELETGRIQCMRLYLSQPSPLWIHVKVQLKRLAFYRAATADEVWAYIEEESRRAEALAREVRRSQASSSHGGGSGSAAGNGAGLGEGEGGSPGAGAGGNGRLGVECKVESMDAAGARAHHPLDALSNSGSEDYNVDGNDDETGTHNTRTHPTTHPLEGKKTHLLVRLMSERVKL